MSQQYDPEWIAEVEKFLWDRPSVACPEKIADIYFTLTGYCTRLLSLVKQQAEDIRKNNEYISDLEYRLDEAMDHI